MYALLLFIENKFKINYNVRGHIDSVMLFAVVILPARSVSIFGTCWPMWPLSLFSVGILCTRKAAVTVKLYTLWHMFARDFFELFSL